MVLAGAFRPDGHREVRPYLLSQLRCPEVDMNHPKQSARQSVRAPLRLSTYFRASWQSHALARRAVPVNVSARIKFGGHCDLLFEQREIASCRSSASGMWCGRVYGAEEPLAVNSRWLASTEEQAMRAKLAICCAIVAAFAISPAQAAKKKQARTAQQQTAQQPGGIVGGAVGTAGAIAGGAVATAGAIATAPFNPTLMGGPVSTINGPACKPGSITTINGQKMRCQ
jgi:hypothetical protein